MPDPIGAMRFDKVGPLDVEAYARRLGQRLGPHATKRILALLSSTYKALARWGWHNGANPAQIAHKPPIPKTTRQAPSPADVARLVAHAADIGPEFDLFLRLSLSTGLRRGELSAITWGQIDWLRQMLVIDRAVSVTSKGNVIKGTKTNRPRRIAIDDTSLAALERWSQQASSTEGDRFVFTNGGGFTPIHPPVWTHLFRKHVRHLGIEGVSLHSCRHWVASILLAQGIDPATVANQLGHSNITTTLDTYGHMIPGRERTVADMLGAALLPERAKEV